MIPVDGSVWIDFLPVRPTPRTDHLKGPLYHRRVVIAGVLQGTRTEREIGIARGEPVRPDIVAGGGSDIAVRAAGRYRTPRGMGITIDTPIATRGMGNRIPLPVVDHRGLRPAMHFSYEAY